jgi:hypothetical protein
VTAGLIIIGRRVGSESYSSAYGRFRKGS